jgi:selenophosphate synthetase-related protein
MTAAAIDLSVLAGMLRASRNIAAKGDVALAAGRMGLKGVAAVPVGDDCAAIPDGDGYALFAIEGFMNEFVAADPWFAGWCGVMVNLSDIAAMGGRPTAVVDAVWAQATTAPRPSSTECERRPSVMAFRLSVGTRTSNRTAASSPSPSSAAQTGC